MLAYLGTAEAFIDRTVEASEFIAADARICWPEGSFSC